MRQPPWRTSRRIQPALMNDTGPGRPGDVLLVDWRERSADGEANKLRPAVVVGRSDLSVYSDTLLLVPLTSKSDHVIAELTVTFAPSESNGLVVRSYALAHLITGTAKRRLIRRLGRVAPHELASLRDVVTACFHDD